MSDYQMPTEDFEEIKKYTNYKLKKLRDKNPDYKATDVEYALLWKVSQLEHEQKKLKTVVEQLKDAWGSVCAQKSVQEPLPRDYTRTNQ